MRFLIRTLLSFIANWFFNSLGIYACSRWLDGMVIVPPPGVPLYLIVMELGLILTLLNALLRPILLNLFLPLNGLTAGLFSVAMNGFFIFLLSRFTVPLELTDFWAGLAATFIFALLNMLLQMLIPFNDDILDPWVMIRAGVRDGRKADRSPGLVMLEIDGLSYSRLEYAVGSGRMPFVKSLMESGSHSLYQYDCGVPSQTSSCQAGIMYGRNDNICAFRWYDKKNRRVFSSSNPGDASDMEKNLFPNGKRSGILDRGLSVNNIISGNAEESIFTVSSFIPKSRAEQSKRNRDIYYYSLRPYLMAKSLILTVLDAGREVILYLRDCLIGKTPRLNRLAGFYPFVRGGTNILLRDLSTAMIVDAICGGREAMYTTFIGYDEIAHHSGPDSPEAYRALTGIDGSIRKICETIQSAAPRPYELVILSDHGQAYGATFKQRYGESLGDYIRSLAERCTVLGESQKVVSVGNSDDNDANVRAVLNTLKGRDSGPLAQQAYGSLENALSQTEAETAVISAESGDNDILVLASGNLANVYFQVSDEKLTFEEIDGAYPGLIAELTGHPGVGTVICRRENEPVAFGKNGSRGLYTGHVEGQDPLEMYEEADKRAGQLRYLSDFPNTGDLVVISSVYEDGTVAAFEELIGSHGGLGGQQTEPFIMVPSGIMVRGDIVNSTGVFPVLKQVQSLRRRKFRPAVERTPETISPRALLAQIADVKTWVPTLLRTMYFSPSAYKAVIAGPVYNGPALLIQILSFLGTWYVMNRNLASFNFSGTVNFVLLALVIAVEILACYLAMLILRGKRQPWKLTRVIFFTNYWFFFLFGTLTGRFTAAWVLITVLMHVIALVSSAFYAGEMGWRRILPLFLSLLILIPLLWFAVLLIYNFIIFSMRGGGGIFEKMSRVRQDSAVFVKNWLE